MKNDTNMNIKQAEQASGVARQNIRFYEKEGLLHPARNALNAYRQYSPEDVRTLKLIRALRMLDMPLEEIRRVLQGELPLSQAASAQRERLRQRQQELEDAIRFCGELSQQQTDAAALDVDACLARMQAPGSGWFRQWAEDYKKLAAAEHEKVFTFVPDEPVRNAREFTDALFAYANAEGLDLVITQEGISPVFTLDGVEYKATRQTAAVSRVPVTTVRCEMTHPERYEAAISPTRRRVMKFFHYTWIFWLYMGINLLILAPRMNLFSKEGLGAFLLLTALMGCMSVYNFYTIYNENGKHGKGPRK